MSCFILSWILVTTLFCQEIQALNVSAKVGDNVALPCRTTFVQPVDWRYQKYATIDEDYVCTATDQNVTRCDHYSKWPRVNVSMSTPGDYTLTINNVTVDDSGLYHCVEAASAGTRHTFELNVTLPECASSPCQNNGTCVDGDSRYKCTCPVRYNGTNCDIDMHMCSNEPCQQRGTCDNQPNDYRCRCFAGFAGRNCSDIDECSSNPCQNNVTCIDGINSYSCNCSNGLNGNYCNETTTQPNPWTTKPVIIIIIIVLVVAIVVIIVIIGVLYGIHCWRKKLRCFRECGSDNPAEAHALQKSSGKNLGNNG